MNTKQSEGPWDLEICEREGLKPMGWYVWTGDGEHSICRSPTYDPDAPEDEQRKANAKLISATPELLKAVLHARNFFASLPEGWLAKLPAEVGELNQFYLAADKALKKAEIE